MTPGPVPEAGPHDLIAFVRDRLAEAEQEADLFHELACAAQTRDGQDRSGPGSQRCRCPVPTQLAAHTRTLQRVLHDCEHRIREEVPQDPHWPLDQVFAELTLRAIALPYELHPQWREQWRP